MRLLRQKSTGFIYTWTEALAKRKDMELVPIVDTDSKPVEQAPLSEPEPPSFTHAESTKVDTPWVMVAKRGRPKKRVADV